MQKRVLFILFSCMFLLMGCGKESSISIQGWEPLEKEPVIETPQQEITVSPTIYANITPILQNKKELVQKWAEKNEAEIFCQNFANEIYEARQITINQNTYSILVCINGFYDAENCKDLWKNHAKQTAEFVSSHQKIDASMDGYATEHVGYWKCLSNDYYSVYSYYHPDYPQLVIQIKGITNTKATKEDALQMWDALQKEEDGFFSIIEKYDIRDENTYTTILAEEFFRDAEIYNKNHPVEFAAYDKERKKLIERRETATARKIKEQKEQKEMEKLIKKAQKAEEKEIRNNEIKNRQRDRYLGIAGDYHHYHTRKIPKNHILHQVTNMDIER